MISVIVPVYKVEPYLRQCVDSILGQTYRDIEVLLIDDGSPDRCGEICDEYERQDARVRVFHTENRGLSAARNLGVSAAKGDYIGFVDSDDWIEPDMYEVLLRRMQETGADIGVCGLWYEFATKRIESPCTEAVYAPNDAIYALICGDLKIQVMNKLWSIEIAKMLQFPEGHVFEDIFAVHHVLLKTEQVATVGRTMYRYRQRKGSIARVYPMQNLIDYWNAIHERYEFLRSFYGDTQPADFEYELRKQCANAIVRTWRWFYGVSENKRDYRFLKELNSFVLQNYSLFGDKKWPFTLRVSICLAHSKSAASLGLVYGLNYVFWNMRCSHSLWA